MAIMLFLASLLPAVLGSDCKFMQFDCSDIYNSGQTVSGIYTIYPAGDIPVWVYCEMISGGKDEDNGGWTVIQRRMDGSVNFYRPWNQYKRGFGNVEREYWLGLENMYQLTRKNKYKYSFFPVGCECAGYQLHVSGFTDGRAGDSLSGHNGQKFSTFDKDSEKNCAKQNLGGFWYVDCHITNPNGVYLWGEDPTYHAIGVVWSTWKKYAVSMKTFSMKIKYVS
ncbi:microfibril-associated glycoprotein 4-like [Carassius carassius]|uniref:microfibril-associated glycoprotein 4-like n=1 Tax=Carassius carassius TaxID=217509 RepID=UPI0028696655|nr:microfibril-associated glycoprotein 4-like [Carassius carassius]